MSTFVNPLHAWFLYAWNRAYENHAQDRHMTVARRMHRQQLPKDLESSNSTWVFQAKIHLSTRLKIS